MNDFHIYRTVPLQLHTVPYSNCTISTRAVQRILQCPQADSSDEIRVLPSTERSKFCIAVRSAGDADMPTAQRIYPRLM